MFGVQLKLLSHMFQNNSIDKSKMKEKVWVMILFHLVSKRALSLMSSFSHDAEK